MQLRRLVYSRREISWLDARGVRHGCDAGPKGMQGQPAPGSGVRTDLAVGRSGRRMPLASRGRSWASGALFALPPRRLGQWRQTVPTLLLSSPASVLHAAYDEDPHSHARNVYVHKPNTLCRTAHHSVMDHVRVPARPPALIWLRYFTFSLSRCLFPGQTTPTP